MKRSPDLKQMLREMRGYRCEGYSGSRVRRADKVVEFETFDLGNAHVLEDVCKALKEKKCKWDEHWLFDEMKNRLSGYDALWLTTRAGVKRYCREDETPDKHPVTRDMIPTSDLGSDGTLFLIRRQK